jgi:hypothetical protein
MWQLFIEAIVVGVMTCVIGAALIYLFCDVHIFRKSLVKLLFTLFLTGAFIHLGCEISGMNKWYCKHGYACGASHKNLL